ncbi:MAG: glycosyltransferase family 9 protein [Desulfatirhabdiaceae bacterium]
MPRIKHYWDILITYFIMLLDWGVISLSPKRRNGSDQLLIVRVDYIGDFILWLDTAKYLREKFSDYNITLITYQPCKDLAEKFPYWDHVWSLDLNRFRYNPIYRFQVARKVCNFGFKIAIQPTHSRTFFCGDSIIRASNSLIRIGVTGDMSNITPWRKKISDSWYTHLIITQSDQEIIRNSQFINVLLDIDTKPHISKIPVIANLSTNLQVHRPYYVLFPGASSKHRRWPVENFIELSIRINNECGWKGVVCGVAEEYELCEKIVSGNSSKLVNLAGKTNLLELIEIIRNGSLLISNDTSGIHIAPSVDTPSVCILGGGQKNRFFPYPVETMPGEFSPLCVTYNMSCFGCDWRCKYQLHKDSPFPCIKQIAVDDVLKTCRKLVDFR